MSLSEVVRKYQGIKVDEKDFLTEAEDPRNL
jgi:hypothetical protein